MNWKTLCNTIKTALWNLSSTKINEYEVVFPFIDKGIDIIYINYKNKMIAEVTDEIQFYKGISISVPLDESALYDIIRAVETAYGKETYPILPIPTKAFSWKGILSEEHYTERNTVLNTVKKYTNLRSDSIDINAASLLYSAYVNMEQNNDSFVFKTKYDEEDKMSYFDFILNAKPIYRERSYLW